MSGCWRHEFQQLADGIEVRANSRLIHALVGPPFPIQEQRFNDFSPVGIVNRLHRCPATKNGNLLIGPSLDLFLDFFLDLFSCLWITKDIINGFVINRR
jgi:hypothetical protein